MEIELVPKNLEHESVNASCLRKINVWARPIDLNSNCDYIALHITHGLWEQSLNAIFLFYNRMGNTWNLGTLSSPTNMFLGTAVYLIDYPLCFTPFNLRRACDKLSISCSTEFTACVIDLIACAQNHFKRSML
jgi:hypothetical protein